MSRMNTGEGKNGLAQVDPNAGALDPGTGGVFRLDSMAPGVANAEQAMIAPRKGKVSTQAIVLGILIVVGFGVVYGMRIVGIGAIRAFAAAPLPEYDLTKTGNKTEDHKRIIDQLAADYTTSQVPIEQTQKNPFKLAEALQSQPKSVAGAPGEDPSKMSAERAEREARGKRAKVEAAAAALKLNGVLGGTKPVARISGEAVRVGDKVGDYFTVTAIHGRSVELEYEGQTFTLRLDEDGMNSNKPHSGTGK